MDTAPLSRLFRSHFGTKPLPPIPLPASGSARRYYRLQDKQGRHCIGTIHADDAENRAFVSMTRFFLSKNIAVPRIYAENLPEGIYLQEDLGNESLLDRLQAIRQDADFEQKTIELYDGVLERLLYLQIAGIESWEENGLPEIPTFGHKAMLSDMHYFKYCLLKPLHAKVKINEQALEKEFSTIAQLLNDAKPQYFMHRDCQARNIMWHKQQAFFIDYQGGMRGALGYDLASLLFQAKAQLTNHVRHVLLKRYTAMVQQQTGLSASALEQQYAGFVLLRNLQTLGVYGLRGLFEKKQHFVDSLPLAVSNLKNLLTTKDFLPVELPELLRVAEQLYTQFCPATNSTNNKPNKTLTDKKLNIFINSFSYRDSSPPSDSVHGAGFVFDCRALHNPGRYEPYKYLNGKDHAVKLFLETESHVTDFLTHVWGLVIPSIKIYMQREFESLTISFGCTGGQHRSVYCAEQTYVYLQKQFGQQIDLHLCHYNTERWLRNGD